MISGTQAGEILALQLVTLLISIGAFAIAVSAIRRWDRTKTLDLRLALGKDLNNLRSSAADLAIVIDRAQQLSREGITPKESAKTQSALWRDPDWDADRSALQRLIAQLPGSHQAFLRLGKSELEAKILEVHGISVEISRLSEKYRGTRVDNCGPEKSD
jgi:hypothetical protein